MGRGEAYVQSGDEEIRETYEDPQSIESYVDDVFDTPSLASHSPKYLLEAIESEGTRTVTEQGEEKERYRFFDDPANEGEHAILGNTDVLNDFVDDLRSIAAGRGKEEKILWVEGATATGKSELKRCLINGLQEYSKTPEGKRYTLEWNIDTASGDTRGLAYGDESTSSEDDWYESPVQTHPLSVFPEDTRDALLEELNASTDDPIDIVVDSELDPFSREAYDYLTDHYRRQGEEDIFSAVTDEDHLRVKNYVVDVGQGIGVLHSEDDGRPKERLVGSWMRGMLQELDSRGRKNPQAFSYDGVLSQGNGLLTIVEDAAQHADLLKKLLNVPDEQHVKLDKGIGMDLDTQMLIISNPDLEAQLNQHQDNPADPLKALKRRLEKHEFDYLTNVSLERELLEREFTNRTDVWEFDSYDEMEDRLAEGLTVTTKDDDGYVVEKEFAPHALEAAAMYSVVTRLEPDDQFDEGDLIDKAILFDRGYLEEDGERQYMDDLDAELQPEDGETGIPVTYTRDVLAELLQDEQDGKYDHVIMPETVLMTMADGLADEPQFGSSEETQFENLVPPVSGYVFEKQEQDVIDAMMQDVGVTESEIESYIDTIYARHDDMDIGPQEIEKDKTRLNQELKVFETEKLGKFDPTNDYRTRDHSGKSDVKEFRQEIRNEIRRKGMDMAGDGWKVDDIDVTSLESIGTPVEASDWDDVQRVYEDFDPQVWHDDTGNTETKELKDKTLENMVDMGYTEESAELTSNRVITEVADRWD